MSSPSNSFFTKEDLSPHEQYIMFIGYMERVFDEMRSQSNTYVEKQITELVMVILNKKVVELLFPEFGKSTHVLDKVVLSNLGAPSFESIA